MRSISIRVLSLCAIVLMAMYLPAPAQVNTAWVNTYDGNLDPPGFNLAQKLVVDYQGNIYVTGLSQTHAIDYDYDIVTIKYLPDGTIAWMNIYDGSASISEKGTNLVVAESGEA